MSLKKELDMTTYKIGKNKKRTQSAKELKSLRQEEIKALGLELQAEGMPFRDVFVAIKAKGYRIGYNTLFELLKD